MSTVAKVWRRVLNVFAPGSISGVDDTGPVMRAQVKIGYLEINDSVPILQQFGFASVPPSGSDVAVMFIGGDRSNGAGVATNHQGSRFRGKASGESVLFNAFGMSVLMSAGGIVINTGGVPMVVEGNLHVTGEVIRGFGGPDQVTLGLHNHGGGGAAPTPGT